MGGVRGRGGERGVRGGSERAPVCGWERGMRERVFGRGGRGMRGGIEREGDEREEGG